MNINIKKTGTDSDSDSRSETQIKNKVYKCKRCHRGSWIGSVIGGAVGLTLLIRWIVNMSMENKID